jgi:hypothetical protein
MENERIDFKVSCGCHSFITEIYFETEFTETLFGRPHNRVIFFTNKK